MAQEVQGIPEIRIDLSPEWLEQALHSSCISGVAQQASGFGQQRQEKTETYGPHIKLINTPIFLTTLQALMQIQLGSARSTQEKLIT